MSGKRSIVLALVLLLSGLLLVMLFRGVRDTQAYYCLGSGVVTGLVYLVGGDSLLDEISKSTFWHLAVGGAPLPDDHPANRHTGRNLIILAAAVVAVGAVSWILLR